LKCHSGGTDLLFVLLGEFALAVLLQQLNVWSLLTVSNCFIRRQVFHKKTSWVEKSLGLAPAVGLGGKKNRTTIQDLGVVDKEISVL